MQDQTAVGPADGPPRHFPSAGGLGPLAEAIDADLRAIFPDGGLPPATARPGRPAVQRFTAGADGALRPVSRVRPRASRGLFGRGGPPLGTAGELVYAVGDIHGCYELLRELIARIADDVIARRPARPPVVVFCGDYIDRGPDSAKVLEALDWLQRRAPWQVCLLMGNHDACLLEFIEAPFAGGAWLRFGGAETLRSYGVDEPRAGEGPVALEQARDQLLARMPAAHLRLLQTLDLMVIIGDYAFVHAGVAPRTRLERQRPADLMWIRDEFLESGKAAAKVIVHGHTWVDDRPQLLGHRIGVDTGAYETGVLTAVRLCDAEVDALQVWDPARPPPASRRAAPGQGRRLVHAPPDFAVALGQLVVSGRLSRDGAYPRGA